MKLWPVLILPSYSAESFLNKSVSLLIQTNYLILYQYHKIRCILRPKLSLVRKGRDCPSLDIKTIANRCILRVLMAYGGEYPNFEQIFYPTPA